MNSQQFWEQIDKILSEYVVMAKAELTKRWGAWRIDLTQIEYHEAIAALMARQTTLAIHLANAPVIWNGHIAPIVLRTMVDVYINFAWILEDPLGRSRKFILHGLGQEKLYLEHFKAWLEESGEDHLENPVVKHIESWINSQRAEYLTEVNLGSWSGLNTREMAVQAGCLGLYNFAYQGFSSATHSMWNHVSKYNLQNCVNPLHRYHRVPSIPDLQPDIDYVYRAAKYVDKTFRQFDKKTGVKVSTPSSIEKFVNSLNELERIAGTKLDESDMPKAE